jgi:cytochrome c5
MPAKGGNSDLTDDEVKRAVAFMANKAGANWTAPPRCTAGRVAGNRAARRCSDPASTRAAPPPPRPPPCAAACSGARPSDGKKDYRSGVHRLPRCRHRRCAEIRRQGRMGAAHQNGDDALYTAALHGKGAMPPKGGNTTLPEADVKGRRRFHGGGGEVKRCANA